MTKQQYLGDLQHLLTVFMTGEDMDEALARIGALFDEAGPEGEDAVAEAMGSAARTAVLLSRGYEPGYIPELDGLLAAAGETMPEPEEEEGPEETPPEDEPATPETGEDPELTVPTDGLWGDIPAFELPDVAADGFVLDDPAPAPEPVWEPPAWNSEPEAEAEPEPVSEPETEADAEPAPEAEEAAPEEQPPEPEGEEAPEAPAEPEAEEPTEENQPEEEPAPPEPEEASPAPPAEQGPYRDYIEEIGPRMVAHEVPDHYLPEDMRPVSQPLPPRYMPLWVGIPLFLIVILALGVPLAPVVLTVFLVLLIPGALMLIAAWLLFVGGLWCVAYIADAVLLFGAAFVVLGLGLIVLWLCLWLGVSLVKLYIRGIRGLGRVCFGRKEASYRA